MSVEALLNKLSDGEFHSGRELGELLSISRTAVWKQLQKLEQMGLALESVKGRGYRLVGGLDLLSREVVESSLTAQAKRQLHTLDIRNIVDSTNAVVAAADIAGYVCAAEQQTAGRGRRGRNWVSPYGQNLYCSLLWEFEGGAAALEGLSLAVGIGVARVVQQLGASGVQLKWPNDVLCDGRKMAGILLEMQGDAAGRCQVVVGIGLNVAMRNGAGIDQPWVDVASVVDDLPSRSRLLAYLLNELVVVLEDFTTGGFAGFRDQWQQLDAYRGREVSVRLGDDLVLGTSAGVDTGGGLIVETESGRRVFNGGEVSLRSES